MYINFCHEYIPTKRGRDSSKEEEKEIIISQISIWIFRGRIRAVLHSPFSTAHYISP